jgi:hypothetical protein
MNSNQFQWTDELVQEYLKEMVIGDLGQQYNSIEKFKASKQKPLEYEILEYGYAQQQNNEPDIQYISKVKRLSDNEVFSIGDPTNFGVIKEIEQYNPFNGGLKIKFDDNTVHTIEFLQKATPKQPLYTSVDGKDIFEGDDFWLLYTAPNGIGNPSLTKARKELTLQPYMLAFSTEESANEFVYSSREVLSAKEVLELMVALGESLATETILDGLIEIVKSKSK